MTPGELERWRAGAVAHQAREEAEREARKAALRVERRAKAAAEEQRRAEVMAGAAELVRGHFGGKSNG